MIRLIVLLVAALVAIAVAPCMNAIASGPASGAAYIALGDSYAAGEGLGPFEAGTNNRNAVHRNTCHRSQRRAFSDLIPGVVLPWISSRGFWACSGATVADMVSVPPQSGNAEQYRQPAQIATVGPSTRWISVSVGGDDVQFKDIGQACAGAEISHSRFQRIPGTPPCATVLANETARLGAVEANLQQLYHRLLNTAPASKLVVVGYPRIFPASFQGLPVYQHQPFCIVNHYQPVVTLDIGLRVADAQAVDRFEVALNATVRAASRMPDYPQDAGRIAYADTYNRSVPRNCRGTTPHASVNGLVLSPALRGADKWYLRMVAGGTFHPTADGQRMMAGAVQDAFVRLGARKPVVPGGGGTVTAAGRVGGLRLGRSTYADIVRFAGPPDVIADAAGSGIPPILGYGYGCGHSSRIAYLPPNTFCHVGFYVNLNTGRLIEFATDSSRYAAFGRIHVGAGTTHAANVAHSPALGGCSDGIHVHAHGRFGYPVLSLLIRGARHGRPRVHNGSSEIPLIGGHVSSIVLNGGADVFDCE